MDPLTTTSTVGAIAAVIIGFILSRSRSRDARITDLETQLRERIDAQIAEWQADMTALRDQLHASEAREQECLRANQELRLEIVDLKIRLVRLESVTD